MPFIEIMFCGLATCIFPVFPVPRRTAKAGGLRGHQHRSLPVTGSVPSGFPTPRFSGDPWEAAAPLPLRGSRGDGGVPWVPFGSILHYQTPLALSIGNFYNSLLGWKR